MKKQHIIIISIVAVVVIIIGYVFLFKGNNSKQGSNFNTQEQNQNIETATIESLSVGNWVSVVAEKVDGSYTASMIMACEDKDSCQTGGPSQDNTQNSPTDGTSTGEMPSGTPPSGTAPNDNQGKIGSNMENKTMLSGTITEVNSDNVVLSLDTGETATVLISDSTRITER